MNGWKVGDTALCVRVCVWVNRLLLYEVDRCAMGYMQCGVHDSNNLVITGKVNK